MIRNQTNLSVANWNTLVTVVDAIVSNHNQDASTYMQIRVRLDGFAKIYEAVFEESDIDFEAFKNKLVNVFGVNPTLVTYVPSVIHLLNRDSVNVVYSLSALPRFTIGFFGRDLLNNGCTWDESKLECIEYLRINDVSWNGA